MAFKDFAFFHRLRVRWAEVDMQSVVFNGHYLSYFDVALTEYWRAVNLPSPIEQAKNGNELFVKKAILEYHASAKFDDELDIGVRTARIGNSSLTIVIEIYKDTQLLVSGEMIYVFVDTSVGRSTAIPTFWKELLQQFDASIPISN